MINYVVKVIHANLIHYIVFVNKIYYQVIFFFLSGQVVKVWKGRMRRIRRMTFYLHPWHESLHVYTYQVETDSTESCIVSLVLGSGIGLVKVRVGLWVALGYAIRCDRSRNPVNLSLHLVLNVLDPIKKLKIKIKDTLSN